MARAWVEQHITRDVLARAEYCRNAKPEMADAIRSEMRAFEAAAARAAHALAPRYVNSLGLALALRTDRNAADADARDHVLSLARKAPADQFCRLLLRQLRTDSATSLADRHGKSLDTMGVDTACGIEGNTNSWLRP